MVEYSLDEAEKLLNKNLERSHLNIATYVFNYLTQDDDINFLKEQVTVMEVNIARVHNYKVEQEKFQQQN